MYGDEIKIIFLKVENRYISITNKKSLLLKHIYYSKSFWLYNIFKNVKQRFLPGSRIVQSRTERKKKNIHVINFIEALDLIFLENTNDSHYLTNQITFIETNSSY